MSKIEEKKEEKEEKEILTERMKYIKLYDQELRKAKILSPAPDTAGGGPGPGLQLLLSGQPGPSGGLGGRACSL